jgi:hypothetical protein
LTWTVILLGFSVSRGCGLPPLLLIGDSAGAIPRPVLLSTNYTLAACLGLGHELRAESMIAVLAEARHLVSMKEIKSLNGIKLYHNSGNQRLVDMECLRISFTEFDFPNKLAIYINWHFVQYDIWHAA